VDLETIPRQQSQSHTPNHETDINTLQTVNQRPSQFNTTEMNLASVEQELLVLTEQLSSFQVFVELVMLSL
jgi:hypothetical protein